MTIIIDGEAKTFPTGHYTLLDMMKDNYILSFETKVMLNGKAVAMPNWTSTFLKEGDVVSVRRIE